MLLSLRPHCFFGGKWWLPLEGGASAALLPSESQALASLVLTGSTGGFGAQKTWTQTPAPLPTLCDLRQVP